MKLHSLRDLYIIELKDLYDCENRVVKALPKLAAVARSAALREAIEGHLREAESQVERLEQILGNLNEPPKGQKCKGVEGILDEGDNWLDKDAPPAILDAALIAVIQRVKHYEMAAYGTARTYARRLGYEDQARLLDETLHEEGDTDKTLTSLAESYLNENTKSAT